MMPTKEERLQEEKETVIRENKAISMFGDKYLTEMSIHPDANTRVSFFVGLYLVVKSAQLQSVSMRETLNLVKTALKKAKIG